MFGVLIWYYHDISLRLTYCDCCWKMRSLLATSVKHTPAHQNHILHAPRYHSARTSLPSTSQSQANRLQAMLTIAVFVTYSRFAFQFNLRLPTPFQGLIAMFVNQPHGPFHIIFAWHRPLRGIRRIDIQV